MPLLPSALPPKGEARRYVANDFLNLIALPQVGGRLRYEDTAFLDTTPFPDGEGKEEGASPPKKEANPASLRSAAPSKGRGSRGHSLLPMEGGAPKGRRLDGGSRMKKIEGRSSQVRRLREQRYPHIVRANTRICGKRITTDKAFPAWGRWRAERAG